MKYIQVIFWFIVLALLFAFLQTQHAYHFFYIEQYQLFQNTWYYVADSLFQPGGLALVTSGFLVQFFILPYTGALIMSLLLTLAGLFTSLVLKRMAPKADLFVLGLVPAVLLVFIQFDFNYLTHGTVAYVFTVILLWAVLHTNDFRKRLALHFLATFVLFYIAGPVYLLYAVSVTLYELTNKSPRNYLALLILPEAILIGTGSVYFQLYAEYRFSFLPDTYYHPKQIPPIQIYFSWIAFVLLMMVAAWVKNREISKKKGYILQGVQIALVAGLCIWGFPKYDDSKSYKVKELDYYCRTEQWDKILERCKGKLTNYLYMCYLNIALMEKGELADKMFSYDQHGPQGILVDWNKTAPISVLLNDIYFAINYITFAQEMAFEAYTGSMNGGNPRMLKRLVQTNLIYGHYPVAEKYIGILENTLFYKEWAREHRKFLYNDENVGNDPFLGLKRRSLIAENTLARLRGLDVDITQLAEQNPSYGSTIEFLGGYYLLAKDVQRFGLLVEKQYGTEVLPDLPKSFQEAVITLFENDPEKWRKYNVSDVTIKRFGEFRKQILANKNNPAVLPGLLNRSYGDTYWFYFMFK